MRVNWFGSEPWNKAACAPEFKIDTPVGTKCLECTGLITERDRGYVTGCSPSIWGNWQLTKDGTVYVVCSYHLGCFLAIVENGHIEGTRVEERAKGATQAKSESIIRGNSQRLREPVDPDIAEDATPGGGWRK